MKSTIKFDLDSENNPIIVVKYVESDDLRDKVVKSFMQGFGHDSSLASIKFESSSGIVSDILIIKPIKDWVRDVVYNGYPYDSTVGTCNTTPTGNNENDKREQ